MEKFYLKLVLRKIIFKRNKYDYYKDVHVQLNQSFITGIIIEKLCNQIHSKDHVSLGE